MDSIWINSPAKINLALDVIRKREDGYHDVSMVMQSVRLFDRLTFTKTNNNGITLSSNLGFLPNDENNLVYQAADLLRKEFGVGGGLEIKLEKRIPVAAGMAGGSTDAAGCFMALNKLYGLGLSEQELMDRGVTLGADIPYCIMRGTALSEGIGEILTPLPPAPDCFLLIVKPKIHVSTGFVYTNLHLTEETKHPDISAMISAIKNGSVSQMVDSLGNILEDVTIPHHPEIQDIKDTLLTNGALGALMSGSGPTVFGIFDDKDKIEFAKKKCKELPYNCFVFSTDFYRV